MTSARVLGLLGLMLLFQNCSGMYALPIVDPKTNNLVAPSNLDEDEDLGGGGGTDLPNTPIATPTPRPQASPTPSNPIPDLPSLPDLTEAKATIRDSIAMMQETLDTLKDIPTFFLSSSQKAKRTAAITQLQNGINRLNAALTVLENNPTPAQADAALADVTAVLAETVQTGTSFAEEVPGEYKEDLEQFIRDITANKSVIETVKNQIPK